MGQASAELVSEELCLDLMKLPKDRTACAQVQQTSLCRLLPICTSNGAVASGFPSLEFDVQPLACSCQGISSDQCSLGRLEVCWNPGCNAMMCEGCHGMEASYVAILLQKVFLRPVATQHLQHQTSCTAHNDEICATASEGSRVRGREAHDPGSLACQALSLRMSLSIH